MLLPSLEKIAIGCDWYSVCVVRLPNFAANISITEVMAVVWSHLDDESQYRLMANLVSASSTVDNPRCVSPSSPFYPSLVQLLQFDALQRLDISPVGETVSAVPIVAGDHVVVVGRDMDDVRQIAMTVGGSLASIAKQKELCMEEGDLRSGGVQIGGLRLLVINERLDVGVSPEAIRDLSSGLAESLKGPAPGDAAKRTFTDWAWSHLPGMPMSAESNDVAKRVVSAVRGASCSTYITPAEIAETIENVSLRWSRFTNSLDHRDLISSVVERARSAASPQPVAMMQSDPAVAP